VQNRKIDLLLAAGLTICLFGGCGPKGEQDSSQRTPHSSEIAQASKITGYSALPFWAPEHPSKAFLRAAKVLRPIPVESYIRRQEADPINGSLFIKCAYTLEPIYELFGLLTDKQIQQFILSKKIRLPVKTLNTAQHKVLNDFFEVFRKTMENEPTIDDDCLVMLYKKGAQEDLSNVDLGFVHDGINVYFQFWIRPSDSDIDLESFRISLI
jgi:hypothetical protein